VQWPSTGVPGNPGAWLTAVARPRYVDGVRRQASFERKVAEISRELAEAENPMDEIEFDDHVEDDVLRLMPLKPRIEDLPTRCLLSTSR
jgi:predicted RNA polymerase sigma factor